MFIVALLMIPKGRVRAWSTILTVMAVMTGGTQLVEGAHFVASQANQVKSTKTDEFSEKFHRERGESFSIRKFMLQILDLYIVFFRTFSEKKCNIIFRK